MSNKSKYVTCSYCGEKNVENVTVCCKCGRIIQAREKAPFDYKTIAALIVVLVIIAAICGAALFVKSHWYEYWSEFHYWYLNNEETVSTILFAIIIITTTIIVCKFSEAKTFSSIYGTSIVIMFVLGLIVECLDVCMTGNPFSSLLDIVIGVLVLSVAPSVIVKIIRSLNN